MTYEQYQASGYHYSDYAALSQWQRLRGLWSAWYSSSAPDKGVHFVALWDHDDDQADWARIGDWWHPRRWSLWRLGLDQCQNFHRLNLGPCAVLFVC